MSRHRIDRVMLRRLIILLLWLSSAALYAASNDDFGRLFSHASERSTLDKLRKNQKYKIEAMPVIIAPMAQPLPESVQLQGYVKRGDGKKSTLWINSQAVQEDSSLGNIHIGRLKQRGSSQGANQNLASEGVDVSISADAKPIRLQAGQRYVPETHQIKALSGAEK